MQHGREGALPGLLLQDPRHVGIAFARVNDQRQPGFPRRRNMLTQALLLRRARATTASSSAAKSGKSRWQWLSTSIVRSLLRARHSAGTPARAPAAGRRE